MPDRDTIWELRSTKGASPLVNPGMALAISNNARLTVTSSFTLRRMVTMMSISAVVLDLSRGWVLLLNVNLDVEAIQLI
jgi:hypothetical protein